MDIPDAFWWALLVQIALFLLVRLGIDIRTSLQEVEKTLEAMYRLLEIIEETCDNRRRTPTGTPVALTSTCPVRRLHTAQTPCLSPLTGLLRITRQTAEIRTA